MSATELDPNEPNLEDEQKPVLFDIQLKNRLETDFQRYYEVSKEDPGDDDFPETAKTPENVMSATDLDPNEGVMVAFPTLIVILLWFILESCCLVPIIMNSLLSSLILS